MQIAVHYKQCKKECPRPEELASCVTLPEWEIITACVNDVDINAICSTFLCCMMDCVKIPAINNDLKA